MIFKILNFLFGRPKIQTGAIGDTRTELQKEGAYDARELVTSTEPLVWKEKTSWNRYPVKRQYYTGECVAQSTAKHLGINNEKDNGQYVDLSPAFLYYFRVNKPSAGMVWLDAMKLATTLGSCFGFRLKQRTRDSDPETQPTDEMKKEALDFKGKLFIEDKERTLDTIARIIDIQGSCLVWFYFDTDGAEWWKVEPKTIYNFSSPYANGTTRHALVATDWGLLRGKKVIKIEDSAGNNSAENEQDRFIDENFIKRCFVSGYVIDEPADIPVPNKPKWTGKRNLQVGMSGADVKQLQDILRYEGLFNFPNSTSFYGGITKASVIKLQEKYSNEILKPVGLTKCTGLVYNSTRNWLDKNYK